MLLDGGEVDTFLVHKITDMDESCVESLADGIPAVTRDKAREVVDFIQARIEAFVAGYNAWRK